MVGVAGQGFASFPVPHDFAFDSEARERTERQARLSCGLREDHI
jgi:hypothetical protein